ncbi:MAG: DUF2125 domain-containing protein [Kiloniellales bacterium]
MEKSSGKKRRRNPLVVGVAALVLLVIVAVPGLWWLARNQVSVAVASAQRDAAREGIMLDHEGLSFSGFPLYISAAVANPKADWAEGLWRGPESMTGETSFTDPTNIRFNASGRHVLDVGTLSFTADSQEALAVLDVGQQGPEALQASLRDTALQLAGGLGVDLGDARLQSLDLFAAPLSPLTNASQATNVSLDLAGLSLPQALGARLPEMGTTIEEGSLRAVLSGPLTPGPPPSMLQAWRQGGGVLRLQQLTLTWGPVALEARGTLGLDDRLRIEGTLDLQIAGFPTLLNSLAALSILDRSIARNYGGLLGGMARPRNGKQGRWLSIPLIFQDGQAFLRLPFAKIPVARLQPLVRI